MRFFHTLAEGGQTWAHRVRMVKQVFKIAFSYSFLIGLAYLVYACSSLDLQSGYYHLKGVTLQSFKNQVSVSNPYWYTISGQRLDNDSKLISIKQLLSFTQPRFQNLKNRGWTFLLRSLVIVILSFGAILFFFVLRGTASKRKQHISGKKYVHPLILMLQLKLLNKASKIKIGSLPLVKGTETRHILITGGTGSGKTNCLHQILKTIKAQNHKAIIVDTTQAFVNKYYSSSKDYILNPFDDRGSPWHPWVECTDSFDYESLAESLIPQSYHDHENYWRTAARTLFSSMLQITQDQKKTSELAEWLLYESLDRLAEFVQGTKAAAHIDVNSEKTAASIRSVAASFLTCFEHLKNTDNPFSIREWIQNANEGSFLFLACKPSQRAALNPLLSAWFSVAVRSLLKLDPCFERRIWFVVDELPTIHKLNELESFVSESRKYGGCGIFALQSPAQLEEIYGRFSSQTIIGNCATRIIFAEHDPEIAKRISNSLGEAEIKEYQEGISYGAHEMRDGVTLSQQTKNLPIVSPTKIQSLKTNRALVRLQGNWPITQIKIQSQSHVHFNKRRPCHRKERCSCSNSFF